MTPEEPPFWYTSRSMAPMLSLLLLARASMKPLLKASLHAQSPVSCIACAIRDQGRGVCPVGGDLCWSYTSAMAPRSLSPSVPFPIVPFMRKGPVYSAYRATRTLGRPLRSAVFFTPP